MIWGGKPAINHGDRTGEIKVRMHGICICIENRVTMEKKRLTPLRKKTNQYCWHYMLSARARSQGSLTAATCDQRSHTPGIKRCQRAHALGRDGTQKEKDWTS